MYLPLRFFSLFLYAKSSEGIGDDVGCSLDHLVLSKHTIRHWPRDFLLAKGKLRGLHVMFLSAFYFLRTIATPLLDTCNLETITLKVRGPQGIGYALLLLSCNNSKRRRFRAISFLAWLGSLFF